MSNNESLHSYIELNNVYFGLIHHLLGCMPVFVVDIRSIFPQKDKH